MASYQCILPDTHSILHCFRFSGCGGNGNNFMTGLNCQKNCGGNIAELVQPKKHITVQYSLVQAQLVQSATK